jgi:serine/threonine protein kinase
MAVDHGALLIDRLRGSGLLERGQLDELGRLPEASDPDPRALGRLLLQRGWLTRFQINMIAQGRAKELDLGPYRILDRLGEGGMGQVYKAQHRRMSRIVALKVIRKEKLNSPETVKRFLQEVQAAAQLVHPNIVLAYDAGNVGSTHFLSMEYVEGTDLARYVKQNGPLPVEQACDYVRQAALGLQHAHEHGLVHRDIKPHNLLLAVSRPSVAEVSATSATDKRETTSRGVVKILDMGLARWHGAPERDRAKTQLGAVIGTPDYLAPEQAVDSRSADIRADLYSLGCTLYYLLTGHAPYEAETLAQLLLKHQMEPPTPLEQRRPDVPPAVLAIVRKLMAKRPEDRFQTPAELAAALESVSGRGSGDAPPARFAITEQPPARSTPWDSITEEDGILAAPPATWYERTLVTREKIRPQKRRRPTSQLPVVWLVAAAIFFLVLVSSVGIVLFAKFVQTLPEPQGNSPIAEGQAPRLKPPGPQDRDIKRPPGDERRPARDKGPGLDDRQQPDQEPPPVKGRPLVPRTVEEVRRFTGHSRDVHAIAVSPDGQLIVSGSEDKTVRLWQLDTGKQLFSEEMPGPVRAVAFTSDGTHFLAAADRRLFQWKVSNHRMVALGARVGEYLSPDGRLAVSMQLEDNEWVSHLFDVKSGEELGKLPIRDSASLRVAFSPNGERLMMVGHNVTATLIDARTGLSAGSWQLPGNAGGTPIAWMPDSQRFLADNRAEGVGIFDWRTMKPVRYFEASRDLGFYHMAVSRDGRWALSAGHDRLVRLWDITAGRETHRFEGHDGPVYQVAFCPDGQHAVSASHDNTLRLWKLPIKVEAPAK